MANKKIKSAVTLTEVVLGLILFIGIFTGMFLYLNKNMTDSGYTMDTKYTDAYTKLNGTRNNLDTNIIKIKSAFANTTEADSTWQVAWNGFKGIGETLKLPITFLSTALETMNISFISLDYVPEWAQTLIGMAITVLILFLVIALLKGEQRM